MHGPNVKSCSRGLGCRGRDPNSSSSIKSLLQCHKRHPQRWKRTTREERAARRADRAPNEQMEMVLQLHRVRQPETDDDPTADQEFILREGGWVISMQMLDLATQEALQTFEQMKVCLRPGTADLHPRH